MGRSGFAACCRFALSLELVAFNSELGLLTRQVFLEHLRFLNGLPRIDEAEPDAIFEPASVFDEEGREARATAAEELASRHPRVDERQIKLC